MEMVLPMLLNQTELMLTKTEEQMALSMPMVFLQLQTVVQLLPIQTKTPRKIRMMFGINWIVSVRTFFD
ncbi:MAG: hypothetical protein EBV77_12440 [Gemmatimonadaceae bacterium]|nr:hypothetical protein [Gemmatimonadaceae bacterium]